MGRHITVCRRSEILRTNKQVCRLSRMAWLIHTHRHTHTPTHTHTHRGLPATRSQKLRARISTLSELPTIPTQGLEDRLTAHPVDNCVHFPTVSLALSFGHPLRTCPSSPITSVSVQLWWPNVGMLKKHLSSRIKMMTWDPLPRGRGGGEGAAVHSWPLSYSSRNNDEYSGSSHGPSSALSPGLNCLNTLHKCCHLQFVMLSLTPRPLTLSSGKLCLLHLGPETPNVVGFIPTKQWSCCFVSPKDLPATTESNLPT